MSGWTHLHVLIAVDFAVLVSGRVHGHLGLARSNEGVLGGHDDFAIVGNNVVNELAIAGANVVDELTIVGGGSIVIKLAIVGGNVLDGLAIVGINVVGVSHDGARQKVARKSHKGCTVVVVDGTVLFPKPRRDKARYGWTRLPPIGVLEESGSTRQRHARTRRTPPEPGSDAPVVPLEGWREGRRGATRAVNPGQRRTKGEIQKISSGRLISARAGAQITKARFTSSEKHVSKRMWLTSGIWLTAMSLRTSQR